MLQIKNVDVYYGNRRALREITLDVDESNIVAVIGSNGAGKTTTLKTICGLLQPRQGTILFREVAVEREPAHVHARMGISYVPEGGRIFKKLTVQENLEMGAFVRKDPEQMGKDLRTVYDMFPILKARRKLLAGTLSGGERQMLSIGRALMSNPLLLLFDEPSLGLAPNIVKEIYEKIREIRQKGVTILLVEQNAKKALEIADRGYVLAIGRISLTGSASELANNPEVKKTFLGE